MFRRSSAAIAIAAAAIFAPGLARAIILNDASLVPPAVYNGSSNPSSEFTVDTQTVRQRSIVKVGTGAAVPKPMLSTAAFSLAIFLFCLSLELRRR